MQFICAQGHNWDSSTGAVPLDSAKNPCPVCGADSVTLNERGKSNSPNAPSEGQLYQTPSADLFGDTLAYHPAEESRKNRPWPKVPGYETLQELGRGGMGVVYLARQIQLKRLVALKMILEGAQAGWEQVARFRAEAEAVARLDHPNIVRIHEIGDHDGSPFFSLEYLAGGSLAHKLAGTPLSPLEAARLIESLARAVQVAHDHGIIHRDLKPGNILLTQEGIPKITDFGLAKLRSTDSWQTQTGQILGTPSYMAPEQAGGRIKEIGPAADIYSLGAILYDLLTGWPPFRAESPLDTVMQVVSTEPVPIRQLMPRVPPDLETICLKCLQKEIPKRYLTAEALAQDLVRFIRGEPITARPVGRIERGWRWCRRNPALAALTGSVAALLLIVAIGSLWAAILFNLERNKAVQHFEAAEEARRDATEKLWQSYLDQARAGRWSGQAGRRFNSLEALAKAAEIRPTLELRNEAIACMAMADLRVAKV